jgi:hypothetical protein
MRYVDKLHRDMSSSDLGLVPRANKTDDAAHWRAPVLLPAEPTTLGIWTRRVIVATAIWSVIELPFEIWVSVSPRDAIACITAKILWVALISFVLTGSRVARIAYSFLCTIGLMAVAFALPAEYRAFPPAFVLSSVECTLKAIAFVCLVSAGVYPDEE